MRSFALIAVSVLAVIGIGAAVESTAKTSGPAVAATAPLSPSLPAPLRSAGGYTPRDVAAIAAHGAAARSAATPRRWWRPTTGPLEWQWELDHPLRLDNVSDMGIGARTPTGALARDPTVYDIDGFDNPAPTIAALHRRGDHVICYIEVGAAENYRPDYDEFPRTVLGRRVPGYPAERYLDISSPLVLRVIEDRVSMCARKGFDAIEPDIDDSFSDPTGFSITMAQDVGYDTALSNDAHALGLGFGLKDGDEPGFAAAMERHVDFVLDEQCFQYSTCTAFYPRFARAHKAVLEVEYIGAVGPPAPRFCPLADRYGFDSMLMKVNLAGGREPCR